MQYLPIEGLAAFNKATAELLLGADSPAIKEGRVGVNGDGIVQCMLFDLQDASELRLMWPF